MQNKKVHRDFLSDPKNHLENNRLAKSKQEANPDWTQDFPA
jgi:hypothetical protein